MYLRINETLIPLDGAVINLAGPENSVVLRVSGQNYTLRGEVAESDRAFFSVLQEKDQVVDLGETFKRAQAKAQEAADTKLERGAATLRTPAPVKALACPLAQAHDK